MHNSMIQPAAVESDSSSTERSQTKRHHHSSRDRRPTHHRTTFRGILKRSSPPAPHWSETTSTCNKRGLLDSNTERSHTGRTCTTRTCSTAASVSYSEICFHDDDSSVYYEDIKVCIDECSDRSLRELREDEDDADVEDSKKEKQRTSSDKKKKKKKKKSSRNHSRSKPTGSFRENGTETVRDNDRIRLDKTQKRSNKKADNASHRKKDNIKHKRAQTVVEDKAHGANATRDGIPIPRGSDPAPSDSSKAATRPTNNDPIGRRQGYENYNHNHNRIRNRSSPPDPPGFADVAPPVTEISCTDMSDEDTTLYQFTVYEQHSQQLEKPLLNSTGKTADGEGSLSTQHQTQQQQQSRPRPRLKKLRNRRRLFRMSSVVLSAKFKSILFPLSDAGT